MEYRLIEILANHYTGEVSRYDTTRAIEALRDEAGVDTPFGAALNQLMANWEEQSSSTVSNINAALTSRRENKASDSFDETCEQPNTNDYAGAKASTPSNDVMADWAYTEEPPVCGNEQSLRIPLSTTLRWSRPCTENKKGFKRGELHMLASGFDKKLTLPIPLGTGARIIGVPSQIHRWKSPHFEGDLYSALEGSPALPMILLVEALDFEPDEVVLVIPAVEQLLTVCGYPEEEWKALTTATGPTAQDDLIDYLKSKVKHS